MADAQSNGFTACYRLSDLTSAAAISSSYQVLRRSDTPQAGMTTFIVVLPQATSSSNVRGVVQVEVVNVALIDDAVVPLVSVDLALTNGSYARELRFPPFNRSVVYDPSVGLGVLFGRSTDDGSSSSNTGLIVGVAVAVPLAVALVLVVIGAGVAVAWWRKRALWNQTGSAVDFGGDADVDDQLRSNLQ